MSKIIMEAAKTAAEAVIAQLKKENLLAEKRKVNEKTPFQKTEILLYNYTNFKAAIKDKQAQINYYKKNGYDIFSKSITFAADSMEIKNETDNFEEHISRLEQNIAITKQYIKVLEQTLDSIKDDQYVDIIRLKYFENLTADEVADRLHVDISTVNRNKKRLVDIIKIRLFSDDVIRELM